MRDGERCGGKSTHTGLHGDALLALYGSTTCRIHFGEAALVPGVGLLYGDVGFPRTNADVITAQISNLMPDQQFMVKKVQNRL